MSIEMKEFYRDYYSDEPSEWREIGAICKVDNLLGLLGEQDVPPQPTILEIGCGEGAVLAELAARGIPAKGVELSASGVDAARRRGLEVRLLDSVSTGFADREFDVALLTHVVEHLENPRETLREAARVASWVAVEVPLNYRWRTPRDYRPNPVGHINLYNMKLIRHLLQSTGLDVVGESVTNPSKEVFAFQRGSLGRLQWLVRESALRLASPLAQRVFTYHGALLCRSSA